MRHVTTLRPAIAWVLLGGQLLATSGCHSWQTQTGSAESILAARPEVSHADATDAAVQEAYVNPQSIRISTKSQPKMTEVTGPRVANDSLYGMANDSKQATSVSLADVTAVQFQKGSAGKTVALVAGLTVAAVMTTGAIGVIAWAAECTNGC